MDKRMKGATDRLALEYKRLKKEPIDFIFAEPLPTNILVWHYVIVGPEDTPYAGGFYHGKLEFPPEYPFKPPRISMITPSGRFLTNVRLCLTMSDYHPELWNPSWSVGTIINGLLSFMTEGTPTTGSVEANEIQRKKLAKQSLEFNLRDKVFCELFPSVVKNIEDELEKRKKAEEKGTGEGKKSGDWFRGWFL